MPALLACFDHVSDRHSINFIWQTYAHDHDSKSNRSFSCTLCIESHPTTVNRMPNLRPHIRCDQQRKAGCIVRVENFRPVGHQENPPEEHSKEDWRTSHGDFVCHESPEHVQDHHTPRPNRNHGIGFKRSVPESSDQAGSVSEESRAGRETTDGHDHVREQSPVCERPLELLFGYIFRTLALCRVIAKYTLHQDLDLALAEPTDFGQTDRMIWTSWEEDEENHARGDRDQAFDLHKVSNDSNRQWRSSSYDEKPLPASQSSHASHMKDTVRNITSQSLDCHVSKEENREAFGRFIPLVPSSDGEESCRNEARFASTEQEAGRKIRA
jgi:hypothetical protein